ncbi:MAG: type I 3-dehydroquinate dehydratase [Phycisphaerales bacterium]|nr:MAG: type I 3-dehydroquinate dehydratase [Phycisphaerales bacterium]
MTYLAVPISARNVAQAREQAGRALAQGAEMFELRTDYLEDLTPEMAISVLKDVREAAGAEVPVIVTCRDGREGGAIDYPETLRIAVLLAALGAGAQFVDVEYANFVKPDVRHKIEVQLAWNATCRLVLSAHDFNGTFDDLDRLYREIRAAHPQAVPKLVYTARHINDCFAALDLLHGCEGDAIVLCMGEAGLISRLLARKLGGLVTFASLDEASGTAPGQVTIGQFKDLYRHDSIDAETELFGVIADPVGHSLSPVIHNACFAEQLMNRLYLPLLVQGGRDELFAFLDGLQARPWLAFRGFSITIPHKHSLLEYVRTQGGNVEPLAEQIGAANTLILGSPATSHESQPAAYNTDYAGALDAITAAMGITRDGFCDMSIAVVGAGGVSRALVAGFTDAGAQVTIYNRTVERAEQLAADFGCAHAGLDALASLDARLVVNCTSIGMHPDVDHSPVPQEVLKPDMAVFDTVYNPAETLLLKQARAAGAQTIDGIAMFVNQAMAQFHLFTGAPGNPTLMRQVVLDSLR